MLDRLVEEWRKGKKEWESRSRIHSKLSKLISSSPTPCKPLSLSLVNNTRKSFKFFFCFPMESDRVLFRFLIDVSCLLYSGFWVIDQTVFTTFLRILSKFPDSYSVWILVWISVVWWGLLACLLMSEWILGLCVYASSLKCQFIPLASLRRHYSFLKPVNYFWFTR